MAVCMLGDAIHPTGPPTSSCPDLFRASPSVMPLEGWAALWMAGYPEPVRAGPAMTWQGAAAGLRGGLFRDCARWGPGCEAARTARLRGGDRRGGGIKAGRAAGPERATARRAEWRVGKRAERAPAVEGNGRRRFRHIFRAGFAGIKWD